MNTRKLIASTLFDQLSPVRDCNVQSNALCTHPWQGPTLPGPYYP